MHPGDDEPPGEVPQAGYDDQGDFLPFAPRDCAYPPVGNEPRFRPDSIGIEPSADPSAQRNEVAVIHEHHAYAKDLRRKPRAQRRCSAHEPDDVEYEQHAEHDTERELQPVIAWPRTTPRQQRRRSAAKELERIDTDQNIGDQKSDTQQKQQLRGPLGAHVWALGCGPLASALLLTFHFRGRRRCQRSIEALPAPRLVCAGCPQEQTLITHDEPLGVARRVAAHHADGVRLGDVFGDRHHDGHRLERPAQVIGVEPGDDDAFAAAGELRAGGGQILVEELRLVDGDDFSVVVDKPQQLSRAADLHTLYPHLAMRDDFRFGEPVIEGRFEDLDLLACNLRTAKPADELFAFAAEHTAGNYLNPPVAGASMSYIHDCCSGFGIRDSGLELSRYHAFGCVQGVQTQSLIPNPKSLKCQTRDWYSPVSVLTRIRSPMLMKGG